MQSLSIGVKQSLKLSPQMRKSLEILQMNTLQLRDYISQELQSNPFLESSCSIEEKNSVTIDGDESDNEAMKYDQVGVFSDAENHTVTESYKEQDYYLRYAKGTGCSENSIDTIASNDHSLQSHLIEQIHVEISGAKERIIALYITNLLDEKGYITDSIDEISSHLRCEKNLIASVIKKLRKLDPIGCYAFSLRECIKIQLEDKNLLDSDCLKIINNLDDVINCNIKKLSRIYGIEGAKITEIIGNIRSVEPKPGRNFYCEDPRIAIPDVFIWINQSRDICVNLNTANLPDIFVNDSFLSDVTSRAKEKKEVAKYCKTKIRGANQMVRAIHERARTLYRASCELANIQYEFFEKGINYLKPMHLADIANKIGVHESTASRIGNKLIHCHFGVFEFKYFCSNALDSNVCENKISSKVVKNYIKGLINKEPENKPLSDDVIANTLKTEFGISISRRTVAKYRDVMQIPSSAKRKSQGRYRKIIV